MSSLKWKIEISKTQADGYTKSKTKTTHRLF